MARIELAGIQKRWGKVVGVRDVNIDIADEEFVVFLGPSGCGKTTTMRMLLNLVRPSSGAARVFGVDSKQLGPPELRRIGYVSESMELPLWMTVQGYADYCRPFYPTWDDELASRSIEEFSLPRDRELKSLSRGMRMKAALVGMVSYRPELMLLDEPFTGLAPLVRDEFIRGLLQLTDEEGWSVLLSSHDIDEVERLADRVVLIDAGKKRLDEPTGDLLEKCRRVDVFCSEEILDELEVSSSWYGFRKAGRSASFGLTLTEPEWESEVRSRIPAVERVETNPMTLREVFVMMAKRFRIES